jgi:hypothetical protein
MTAVLATCLIRGGGRAPLNKARTPGIVAFSPGGEKRSGGGRGLARSLARAARLVGRTRSRWNGMPDAPRQGMNMVLILALLAQEVPPPPATPPQPQPVQVREVFWGDRHGVLRHRSVAFVGERPVEGAEFYRAVGREDLAQTYEQNASSGRALVGVGGLAVLFGLVGLAVVSQQRKGCQFTTDCADQPDPALAAISAIGLVGGGVLMLAGANTVSDPMSDDERRVLVAAHNRKLPPPADPGPTWVKPTATFSSKAALLGLAGRF